MKWQDIKSSPKDGSRFDVWAKHWLTTIDKFTYMRFTDCDFSPNSDSIRTWDSSGAKHLFDLGWHPTHWIPLPEPPTT